MRRTPRPALAAAPAAAIALALVLALAAVPARAASFDVNISNLAFTPSNLTIHVGDSVTWHGDGEQHNVRADDGSFRCAQGCDGAGGDGSPSASAWSFTRTFNQAGVVRYFCEIHGAQGGIGMAGSIVVQAVSGGNTPGSLRFSAAAYSAGEGAGSAVITVQRVGGDDGVASVAYQTTGGGTATPGSDFTVRSGSLNWAGGDDAPKTFSVPIADDAAAEGSETVHLLLTNALGASLGSPSAATLTITDNDGGGPGTVPAAPTNLRAAAQSTTEILLTWNDAASNESEFRIERRTLTGTFQQIDTAPAGATSKLVGGLTAATAYVFRVRAANAAGASAPSNEVQEATLALPGPCVEGPTTLCLNGGRFRAEVTWRSATASGPGQAVPLPAAPDSGLFYFFNPGNIEMLIKVLNACPEPFNRFWVFYAATTNVELTLTVTDTQSTKVKVYFNPLNRAAPPEQDTNAFATCP